VAWDVLHRSPEQSALLQDALGRAREGAVCVLDLDSCLFDTRPRQVRILRAYSHEAGWPELNRVRDEHFVSWSLAETLTLAEVAFDDERLEALRLFWWDRFFDGTWHRFDVPLPGAVRFVQELHRRGATLVYLTGRHRPMRAGTLQALHTWAFPIGDGRSTLVTKPRFETPDHEYKRSAAALVRGLGTPVLCLDNEPANVNAFAEVFPEALTLFVATDHSPLPIRPNADLPRIRGFIR
jgi:hypothetical protein